jgi:hypothetical protein
MVLDGAPVCHVLSERYCVRAPLPEEEGGLGRPALYIDGGNSFDPYLLADIAREYRLDIRAVLDHVVVSRAFTVYQLLHLVQQGLPRMLHQWGARFAVIANIFDMFVEDVKPATARKVVQACRIAIQDTCRDTDVIILVTSWQRHPALEALLFPYATVRVEFREMAGALHAVLRKHPLKGEAQCRQPRGRPAIQATLAA